MATGVDGIVGWGLVVRVKGGQCMQVTEPQGCDSETCGHFSHDPAAPVYRWVPDGDLVELGKHGLFVIETYYTWTIEGRTRYLRLTEPPCYYAVLEEVDSSKVPDELLAGGG